MSNIHNERFIETSREDFYQAVSARDWDTARIILADLEDMKVATHELRRHMNQEMGEWSAEQGPDDFTNSEGIEN